MPYDFVRIWFAHHMDYLLHVYISIILRSGVSNLKPLIAALKTRFLFDISSDIRLRYYEIFVPLFALSLHLRENAADTSDTVGM